MGLSAVNGLFMDIAGIFYSRGTATVLYESAPYSGLGFIEAHGLALPRHYFWQAPST